MKLHCRSEAYRNTDRPLPPLTFHLEGAPGALSPTKRLTGVVSPPYPLLSVLSSMRAQLTPPSPRRRVRFRTPEEEVLVAALNGALLLALWPLFFSIRLALLGERLAAQVLGVYFGVLQVQCWGGRAV